MSIVKTQKALLLPAEGGEYRVGESPIPRPGPKEVLVKVISAALNPIDWKIAIPPFSALIAEYPFITGTDGAGVVVEVGEEVTGLKEGDKILFQGWFTNPYATFQQFCIVPAEITALIPDNVSFDQAASVPLALATVVLALYNQHPDYPKTLPNYLTHWGRMFSTLRLKPVWEESGTSEFAGKPVFIIGGASSVGQYAIQIAKLAGFSPIIATASPHNTSLLTSLGATHVIDRSLSDEAILTKLPELTGGKPIELVYDAISLPETMPLAYQALAPGGGLVIVLADVIPAELKKEGDEKRIAYVFGNVHSPENRACGVEMYKRLTEWLEKGIIKPNAVEVLPNGLAGAPEGLERLKNNKVSGTKLITRPQETP
ncbi:GroES-like protein [Cubamyces menziesii]|nr:GroES-like protein [Cubamyces menziesii]